MFYHKIYVLNVIAGAKSHVNFISFVFRSLFTALFLSLSLTFSCFAISDFILAIIFWQQERENEKKKQQQTAQHFVPNDTNNKNKPMHTTDDTMQMWHWLLIGEELQIQGELILNRNLFVGDKMSDFFFLFVIF